MTSKLTREQLHERARENVKALKLASRQTAFESAREEILADLQLAELALAAINSDPVAYAWVSRSGKKHLTRCEPEQWRDAVIVTPLYSHAQPAPERDQVRSEHAEWSQATFGNVGPVGPLKHLSKEALEAAAEPDDLSEWADMQFLMWDAQRRAGISDAEITAAMEEKLKVNMARQWPEPEDGEPRMHIKESGNSPMWIGVDWAKGCEPGNSPAIPNGYMMVPKEPTKEMIDAGWLYFIGTKNPSSKGAYKAMLAAAPQEVKHG